MGQSLFNGPEQIRPGTLTRALLNTATAGSAVIAKLLAGVGTTLTYTGADTGTGDVTLNVLANAPCGRLTLVSGTPVMLSSAVASTSIIYTPYLTNGFPQWNGTFFLDGLFAETNQSLSDTTKSPAAALASSVYDIFGWYDAGTFRATRGPAWTAGTTAGSNTARGAGAGSTALTRVQGILVNQYAITNGPTAGYGVYLGTIATDSSGATVTWNLGSLATGGGQATLNVFNYYNRVRFCPNVRDSTVSHTYKSSTYQAFDASASNSIVFVRGYDEDQVIVSFGTRSTVGAANGYTLISIGLDSTTTPATLSSVGFSQQGLTNISGQSQTTFQGSTGLGAHIFYAIEASDGSNTNTLFGSPYAALLGQFNQ